MNSVLVFDCETDGLDPVANCVIEVGCVLWSVEHRTIIECFSALIYNESNAAEPFNAIPPDALGRGSVSREIAWEITAQSAQQADAVLAHQADFDRAFVEQQGQWNDTREAAETLLSRPWICTIEDFVWPRDHLAGKSLVSIALAHGVAVTSAHRAINDCLLLSRLLERLGGDVDLALEVALERALRPKARFIARTAYKDKDLVKLHGFHWNGTVWHRRMAIEDAEALPFEVVSEQDAIEEVRA